MVNNHILEHVKHFTVSHKHERSRIIGIDQDEFIKWYSTLTIRSFPDQPKMLDDSITDLKLENRYVETGKYTGGLEYSGDDV